MVGAGMFAGLGTLLMAGLIAFVVAILSIGYITIDKFIVNHKTFESHKIITPSIKLHTDGKVIDTIYVYSFK